MDCGDLADEIEHAEILIEEESSRTKTGSGCPDPGLRSRGMSEEDIKSLRRKHKFLEEFSDNFIRHNSIGDLMKIESTAIKIKEMEKNKDADDRLAANKSALPSTFVSVPAGRDNRYNELHEARFLGGAGCSATKLWLAAKSVLGDSVIPAIGCYDMGAVGLAGYVSAKGWAELHNTSSSKISVKMFNINNCAAKASTKKSGEEEDDISEIGEFKLALRTMRTAYAFVMPWNLSVLALEGFFFQTNFCFADLANVEKKAWFLTKFTDYVLQQNGDRWRDSEPFLSAGDLKATWSAFFGAQTHASLGSKMKKQANQQKPSQAKTDPRFSLGICFAWNQGLCLKPAGSCATARGRPLKHICDFAANSAKPAEVCGKDHIRKDFHK